MNNPDEDSSNWPEIGDDEIHLWQINRNYYQKHLLQCFNELSLDEKRRALKYKVLEPQQQFIISRAVIRKILAGYLGISTKELVFSYNRYGKPGLFYESKLQFNISHSRLYSQVAITYIGPVGADIEYIRDSVDTENIARMIFFEDELQEYRQAPDNQKVKKFFQIWTLKEAQLKANGKSLGLMTDRLHKRETQNKEQNNEIKTMELATPSGWIAALAVKESVNTKSLNYLKAIEHVSFGGKRCKKGAVGFPVE